MNICLRTYIPLIIGQLIGIKGLIFFYKDIVSDNKLSGMLVEPVAGTGAKTVIALACILERAVEIDRLTV